MLAFILDTKKCFGDGDCVRDCPRDIFELDDQRHPQVLPDRADKCIKCLHCLAVCKPGAITILGHSPDDSIPLTPDNLPKPEKLEALIKGRRSVRRFQSQPLDKKLIHKLVHTAGHAPTGVNSMAVRYTVIDSPEVMQEFREHVMNTLNLLAEHDAFPKRFENFKAYVKAWHKGNDVIFRNAPHLLVTSAPAAIPTPREDSIIGLSYFELYAAAMGVGTLWCGLGKWAIDDIARKLRKLLYIPADHVIGNMMLFGKPAVRYYRTVERKPHIINVSSLNHD